MVKIVFWSSDGIKKSHYAQENSQVLLTLWKSSDLVVRFLDTKMISKNSLLNSRLRKTGMRQSKWRQIGGAILTPFWWRELDLNQRPFGYEPNELPGCSIPRRVYIIAQTVIFDKTFFGLCDLEQRKREGVGAVTDKYVGR